MRKRVLSLIVAVCMLFGLALNAYAFSGMALDFKDATVTANIPDGWEVVSLKTADAKKFTWSIAADPDNPENQVLHLDKPIKLNSWHSIIYNIEPASEPLVLEYKYRIASGATNDVFLPSFRYAEGGYPVLLRVNAAKTIGYSKSNASGTTWTNVDKTMAADQWHTVKQVVDVSNKLCELYLDGERIALDPAQFTFADNLTIKGVMVGARNTALNVKLYLDDINVSLGVAGESLTFEETAVTVPVNGGKYLKPVFTPVETSIQKVTYASSDETVATVDASGMVFGIKEGTATITATPALTNLAPVEIAVTVGGEVNGTITVPTDALALPVGGHDFVTSSIEFEGGFVGVDHTLIYKSSAPEVATVDSYGEVLAVGAGTATITVQSMANLGITKEITVTVSEPKVMQTIYVAPNGTGDGSSAAAPTTLDGAAAILATIDKAAMTGNVEVILADGYYYRTDALKLTDAHGGSNLYTVVFKAAEGAKPTIGGGVFIDGSEFKDTDNDGIYEYDLSSLNLGENFNTRELYVDNVRSIRARGVEVQKGTILKNAEYLYAEDGTTAIGFICDNKELLDIKRPQDLELAFKVTWVMSRCPVASVEEVDGRVHIIMDQPAFANHAKGKDISDIKPSNITWYENALEILDTPGEWYFNVETQVLYYMPKLWEKMADVTVTLPVFDNWDKTDTGTHGLITILGTTSEQQAQNIRFEGITFADTTWLRPDTKGLPGVQNNNITGITGYKYTQMPIDAAVTVKMANSIKFLDCNFTRLGGGAINMYDGVQNSLIQGCHLYDLSAGAIYIGHPNYTPDNYNPEKLIDRMKNVDVLNNYVHDVSVDYMSSAAITVCYAEDVDLCHNEIFNIPYSGFHLGYGWDKSFTTYARNINVAGNFIHHFFRESGLGDGGAIYTNGATGGDEEHWNVQTGNYIRNQYASTACLYADSGTSWYKVYGNVVDIAESLPLSSSEIQWARRSAGHHNLTFDNYYAGRELVGPDNEERHIYYYNNTFVEDNTNWPAEAQAIIDASGLQGDYAKLRNNQVERIVTAADHISKIKFIVEMDAGKTFDLDAKFLDGKDNPMDTSKAIIYYESLNTDIATVDQNGVITAVADGETTVRLHVVSNDMWDTRDITVYVGDDLAEVALTNQDPEITLTETGGNKYLKPYGVSKSGREVSLDKVTFSIADETVATVDQNGVLSYAGPGETVLTVTAQKLSVTLSATYKIICREGSGMVVDYMEDMFLAENEDKWYHGKAGGTWELTDGERITTSVYNDKTYLGRKLDGELLTFRFRLDQKGSWPSFVLRAMADDKCVGRGGTGYIICFLDTGVQLQRFNGSLRTVLYGTIGGNAAIYGPDIPHSIFFDKEYHEIQLGAVNEEAGVRLMMYIDGVEMFNCVDTSVDALRDPGYFGIVGDKGDGFILEKLGTTEVKHNLTLESDIDFSFFVPKSAVAESGLTATVIQDRANGFEDKTVTLEQANWESYTSDGVEYWRIRYMDVAAKEMTDKLTLVLRDASGVLFTDSYSVAQYAKERIENSTNENMKNLMNIMLHYGAAAQIYFDYKTDDLANEGLAAASTASFRAAANAVSTVKHNLTLESNIDFSFFVPKSDVAASGLTATVLHDRIAGYDDKSSSLTQDKWETLTSGGVEYWRIRYTDVAAKEIADTLTLTITDGTNTVVTDNYSVLQYAQERIQNSSNANMKTLMQMLQAYGAAARLYFGYTAAN